MVVQVRADVKQFQARVAKTLKLFDKVAHELRWMAHYFLNQIEQLTPKKTGDTARAWRIRFHPGRTGEGLIWEIKNEGREEIVRYLEFGTRPHIIVPKDPGGVLAFEVDGKMVFAKNVFHPGTKPLGFVRLTQRDIDLNAEKLGDRLLAQVSAIWS